MGFAEFDMDGRAFTGGEMDRMMMILALSNCFCSVWQCLLLGDVWVAGDVDPAIWIDLDQFVVMFGATVLFHITTNHSQVSPLSNLFPTAKTPGLSEREREREKKTYFSSCSVLSTPLAVNIPLIISMVKSGG